MEQFAYSPKSLGEIIKRQRKSKHLNQTQAGEAFKLEQSTVSSIEQGAAGTRLDTLFRMLAALDLEMIIRAKDSRSTFENESW